VDDDLRDRFRPPASDLPEPPGSGHGRFRILPVVVSALLVDFGGTQIASMVIAFAGNAAAERGVAPATIASVYYWLANIIGACFSALAGYVAARWSGARFLVHGAATAFVVLAINLPTFLTALMGPNPAPVIVSYSAALPAALLGAWFARRRAALLQS